MDSKRLNKISRLVQKELSDIFQKNAQNMLLGTMVSVTVVRFSPDLSYAKAYLSIFPPEKRDECFSIIKENTKQIRYKLGNRVRHQLRKIPELEFFIDDSLDYANRIEELLKE